MGTEGYSFRTSHTLSHFQRWTLALRLSVLVLHLEMILRFQLTASLVFQCLRLLVPNAGGVQSLARELRSPMVQGTTFKKKKKGNVDFSVAQW